MKTIVREQQYLLIVPETIHEAKVLEALADGKIRFQAPTLHTPAAIYIEREVMQFDEQKPGIYLGQAKSRKAQAYEI